MEKVTPKKIKWLPIILAAVVLVGMLAAGAVIFLFDGGQGSAGAGRADDLYWNIDRSQYDGLAEGGTSARNKSADGYYHINFANSGEVIELLTEERKIVNALDGMDICGLEFDENGLIIGYKTYEELGYTNVANRFYVQEVDGTVANINSSMGFDGIADSIDVTEAVKTYDMSGALGIQSVGMPTKLMFRDRLIALEKDGQLSHVFVFERSLGSTAYCEHCEMDAVWSSWDDSAALPTTSGHYILEADIALGGQMNINADQQVILDLNGHQVNGASGKRVYLMAGEGAYLAIFDKSAERTGKIVGSGNIADQGGMIWVRYGTFDFYGGTLDGTYMTNTGNGGIINIHSVAAMNMYDGAKVTGGNTRAVLDLDTGKASGGHGGNFYINGALNIYGGIIENGTATPYQNPETKGYANGKGGNIAMGATGVVNMSGGVIKGGTMNGGSGGGNVYCAGKFTISGTAQVYGGTVTSNVSNGGNFNVSSAGTLTVNGGTIRDGKSGNRGANIALYGTMIMTDGVITGGQNVDENGVLRTEEAYIKDHNLFMVTGNLDMSGGLIEGYAQIGPNVESVKISGTAQITGAAEGGSNLYLQPGKQIELGELKEGANICITGGGFLTTETDKANMEYVHLDHASVPLQYYQNKLFAGIFHCLCGNATGSHVGQCKGATLAWSAWTNKTSLPNTDGYYYLVYDVNMKNQVNIQAVKNKEGQLEQQDVYLDLNGKTVTGASGKRAYLLKADSGSLTITDGTKNPGKITCTASKDNGMIILSSDQVNIYNGILDGSKIDTTGGGGIIRMAAGGELNMYGGEIVGATANNGGNVVIAGNAETKVGSVFNMHGGTIRDGVARIAGGNVYVGNLCTFNFYGGTIRNGLAKSGGNVVNTGSGVINMEGGEILDGTTTKANGGNVSLSGKSVFNMSGGKISGGHAGNQEFVDGDEANGGNICVNRGTQFNLSGGEILDGRAMNRGGNIALYGSMSMTGGSVTGGKNVDKEGNERTGFTYYRDHNIVASGSLDMSGGLVDGYVLLAGTSSAYKISGTAQITGGQRNLYLANNILLEVGQMAEGAKVGITMNVGGGIFSKPGAAAGSEKYFVSDNGSDIAITDEGELFIGQYHCLCGQTHDKNSTICDGTKHIWSPWDSSTNITASGYYYLVDNGTAGDGITERSSMAQVGSTAARDLKVYLDMNGMDYVSTTRAFQVGYGSEMTIFNSKQTGGTIIGAGANKGHTGVILLSNYDAKTGKTDQTATLNLIGVDVVLGDTEATITEAGAIKVTAGCTLNMDGGSVTGGTVTGNGGSIYAEGGTVNLTDVKVTGGNANNGGNICVAFAGTVNLNGTTEVTDGVAVNEGGNVHIGANSNVTMNGESKVTGGREDKNQSGNMSVRGSLVLNDKAEISGGLFGKGNTNRNVRMYGSATLTMADQSAIDGGVVSQNAKAITLSGTPRIYQLDENGAPMTGSGVRNLYMTGSTVIDATGLKAGAQIGVSTSALTNFAQVDAAADETIAACFIGSEGASAKEAYLRQEGEKTYVYFDDTGILYYCLCGQTHDEANTYCDGTVLKWTPWQGAASAKVSGNYYLTDNGTAGDGICSASAMVLIGDSPDANRGVTVNLDMNGLDYASSTRAFQVGYGSTLNVVNTGETGGIISGKGANNGHTGVLLLSNYDAESKKTDQTATVNLYGVNLKLDETTNVITDGGVVKVTAGCALNMENGSVTGGTVTGKGGSIFVEGGEVTLTDVTVTNGVAGAWGGNIYIAAGAQLTMNGESKVTGGRENANQSGNICLDGSLTMNDQAEISGGLWGTNNGNRNVRFNNAAASLTMNDQSVIDGGVTVSKAQSIILSGTPRICQVDKDGNPMVGSGVRNLRILSATVIDATGLEAGARIDVGIGFGSTFASLAEGLTDEQYDARKACFTVGENAYGGKLIREGNLLKVVDPNAMIHCLCGADDGTKTGTVEHLGDCDRVLLTWTAWDGTVKAGNFYLTENRTTNVLANDAAFNLDLNGFSIEHIGSIAPLAKSSGSQTVNICNSSSKPSRIYGVDTRGGSNRSGGTITITIGTLNLYNVNVEAATDSTIVNGGAINVSGTGGFNMYGGSIVGRSVSGHGGAMYIVSTKPVTLEDVAVSGGTATGSGSYGGNIHVAAGAELILAGNTTVTGGIENSNQSGNVAVDGKMTMKDTSQIYGGLWNGTNRNVRLRNNAELIMQDSAAIDGGVVVSAAKSITLSGTVRIYQVDENGQPITGSDVRHMYLASGVVLDATGLKAGAMINVTASVNTKFAKISAEADQTIMDCFSGGQGAYGKTVTKVEQNGEVYLMFT